MMPNQRAGRPRVVLAKATRRATAASRRALGPLHLLKVTPRTATVYTKHLATFFEWMKAEGIVIPSRTEYFDDIVTKFIQHCWEEGEPRSVVGNALSGLQWKSPGLRGR
jgi:hypothetical protein